MGVAPVSAADFLHGFPPRTLDQQDLRSMRAADAVEFDQLGLCVAPRGQRCAPFARTIDRVDTLATADHRAVHDSRGHGPEPSGAGGQDRLIEQR
jgi:hypothetical protein